VHQQPLLLMLMLTSPCLQWALSEPLKLLSWSLF